MDVNVLEIIKEIIEARKKARRIPHCAIYLEIQTRTGISGELLDAELKKLKENGSIHEKRTINSRSFYIAPAKNNNYGT